MPELKEYTAKLTDAPISGGRRAEGGDFGADLGAGGHALQKAAHDLQERVTHDERRQELVANAQITAQTSKELDDARQSGAPLEPIRQKMQDALDKVSTNFTTKDAVAQADVNAAKANHLFAEQANTINVERATSGAKLQGHQLINNLGQQVLTNPASLKSGEETIEAFISTYPQLGKVKGAEMADSLKKDLNAFAAAAAARINPEQAHKDITDGKYNLSPGQLKSALDYADREATAQRVQKSLLEAQQHKAAQTAADKSFGDQQSAIMAGKGSWRAIDSDPALAAFPHLKTQLMHIMKERARELREGPVKEIPAVFNNIRARIDLPANDPRRLSNTEDIWKVYAGGGGLSKSSAEFLERRLRDNRDESGQKLSAAQNELVRNLKPQLDKSTLLNIDNGGGERVQAFTRHVADKVDEFKKEKKDPFLLFKPGSSDYVGNDIPLFQSGAQRMQSNVASQADAALAPRNAAQRRLPNETPKQYLERTKNNGW